MNEQIQKLSKQAGIEFDGSEVLEHEPIYYITQKELSKFAELIVKECVRISRTSTNGFSAGRRMEANFGVES